MALPQLTSSDAEALAREKINAAITEADKVGGIGAALAALQITLAPYTDLVGGTPNRPGDSRTLFTRQMTGAPKLRPAIDKGSVENGGELGQVLRISGADTDPALGYIDVAPRRAYYMRPGRAYLVRHAFARFQDPTDPEQNAVELRFQNLSASFAQVSNVRFGSAYAPAVTDGPLFVDTFIGKAGAPGTPSYVVPPSSAYGVPFFRVFGNGHLTDLGEVWLYDVSDALAGGADIASIIARVARLEVTQSANIILATSWADLAGRQGRVAGAGAEVPDSDTGTHTDPITGAANTPNAGRYQWSVSPAGWRWVSLTTAKQAALFIAASALSTLIEAGVSVSTIPDTALLGLDVDGISQKITFKDFKKMFNPDVYTDFETINVGTTSHVLVGADPNMVEINWQSAGADIAACPTFKRATLDLSTPSVLAADGSSGKIKFGKDGAKAPISFIGSVAGPVTIEITRLTRNYTKYDLYGDDIMSFWPRPDVDDRFRAAMRTALNTAHSLKIEETSRFLFIVGAAEENDAINLFNPTGPTLTYVRGATGIVTTPYESVKGGGDAYIETGQTPAKLNFTETSHHMIAKPGGLNLDAGIHMGNSPNYYLATNVTSDRFRARSGVAVNTFLCGPGKMGGFNRNNATTFDAYQEGVKSETFTRNTGLAPDGTLKLLATASGSAASAISDKPLRFAVCGGGYGNPDQAFDRIYRIFAPVFAVQDLIRSGA